MIMREVQKLGELNIQQKIGQLMIFGFDGKEINNEIKTLIQEFHVGGIILFSRNIGTPKEVHQLTRDLQQVAKEAGHERPLLICIDQENGAVRRLDEGFTTFPGSMLLGATGNAKNAYTVGQMTGRELRSVGINWNLAPVVDVNTNPNNPVIGVRSFGEDPKHVSTFGIQSMKGMQDEGIITSLKHFPGHGDTHVDSHLDIPQVHHELEHLEKVEFIPFKQGINAGADTVLISHVHFPAIEPRENVPATLSKNVVTRLLRNKLGFEGVVTTDCMEMKAISDHVGTPQAGVEALCAGIDLIMVSHTHSVQHETLKTVYQAVETGKLTEETIQTAYDRVISLKDNYLSWDDITFEGDLSPSFDSESHKRRAMNIYKQGVTVVKNEDVLPVSEKDKVLVIYPEEQQNMLVEDQQHGLTLGKMIKQFNDHITIKTVANEINETDIEEIVDEANMYDAVIIGTLNVKKQDYQVRLIEKLVERHSKVIVISLRNPYDYIYLSKDIRAYISTYEYTKPALQTAIEAIFGKINVSGKLPVTLS